MVFITEFLNTSLTVLPRHIHCTNTRQKRESEIRTQITAVFEQEINFQSAAGSPFLQAHDHSGSSNIYIICTLHSLQVQYYTCYLPLASLSTATRVEKQKVNDK